jgi:hypothetical protein
MLLLLQSSQQATQLPARTLSWLQLLAPLLVWTSAKVMLMLQQLQVKQLSRQQLVRWGLLCSTLLLRQAEPAAESCC